ncbi:MAG: hypothetical protein NC311_03020 [Muribaculaceae bacterium]|nr:hypothetical protein [Muribaculaceae bacterium]
MKQILGFALFVFVCATGVSVADIPSVDFVDGRLSQLSDVVDTKADDAAVMHLMGDEEIAGAKTFSGTVTLGTAVADASNDNQVATTKWTNDRVASAKGDIPVGGKDSTTFTKIWIEE